MSARRYNSLRLFKVAGSIKLDPPQKKKNQYVKYSPKMAP